MEPSLRAAPALLPELETCEVEAPAPALLQADSPAVARIGEHIGRQQAAVVVITPNVDVWREIYQGEESTSEG